MLSVKQGEIKDHFLSLCYDSTWIEPRKIGEHSLGQLPESQIMPEK